MSKYKVMYYLDTTQIGDSERAWLAAISSLDQVKFPFRVLLPSLEGPLPDCLRSRGIPFDAIAMPRFRSGWIWRLAPYLRSLFRYYSLYKFEVVHTSGMACHLLSLSLKVRYNVPLIWQLWAMVPRGNVLDLGFQLVAGVFCDQVITSSYAVAAQMGRSVRWRRQLSTLYRGYGPIELSGAASAAITGAAPVIAMAGKLVPWRGHRIWLRALELVRRKHPGCRGVIYVNAEFPGYRGELLALIEEWRLSEVVQIKVIEDNHFDGDLARAMLGDAVSVYVDPSVHSCPFEPAIAEAMAAGIPIVASRSGVFPEILSDAETCLLVTAGDANATCDGILRCIDDPALYDEISSGAVREFIERFEIKNYVRNLEHIYERYATSAFNNERSWDKAA